MGRKFKIGVYVTGSLLLGSSAFFAAQAQAQDDLINGPRQRLVDAVDTADSLRAKQLIGEEEYRDLICSAVQGAVNGGMSASAAVDVGGVSACATVFVGDSARGDGEYAGDDGEYFDEDSEFTSDDGESTGVIGGSGGDAGGSGGHAPVTPIVIPSTTAGSNDSTSPTSN